MYQEDTVMVNYSKQQIVEQARSGIINVRFVKLNGEERDMKCTLLSEYLPNQIEMDFTEVESKDHLAVWDVEVNGWRSFRIESVLEVKPELLTE
jgi:hypothetical protein